MSYFCATGKANIEVIAEDLFGKTTSRSLTIHGLGDRKPPEIITPDEEIFRVNTIDYFGKEIPVLLPGDYVDYSFKVKAPNGIGRVIIELDGETIAELSPQDYGCQVSGTISGSNGFMITQIDEETFQIAQSGIPVFLTDRKFLYSGPRMTKINIFVSDAVTSSADVFDGYKSTTKELDVQLDNYYQPGISFNYLMSITHQTTDSTGMVVDERTMSGNLLPAEGFFVNFANSVPAGINWYDAYKDMSFVKTYMQTYYSTDGRVAWKNISKANLAYEAAVCIAGGILTYFSWGLGGAYFLETCDYASYSVMAPILAAWISGRSGYCGGFATTFPIWRSGTIGYEDFKSCNYNEGDPVATEIKPCSAESKYCYYDCCKVEDRNDLNQCKDTLVSNDLLQYITGMHGKQVTSEFWGYAIRRAAGRYDGITDGFLKRLFFSMKPNPETPLAEHVIIGGSSSGVFDISSLAEITWEDFVDQFNYTWDETASFANGKYLVNHPVVLNLHGGTNHFVTPLHVQRIGEDRIKIYVYDSNNETMTYGLECLRQDNRQEDSSPNDNTIGYSWAKKCGPYKYNYEDSLDPPIEYTPTKPKINIYTLPVIELNLNTNVITYKNIVISSISILTMHDKHQIPLRWVETGWEAISAVIDAVSSISKKNQTIPFFSNEKIRFYNFPISDKKRENRLLWKENGIALYHQNWGESFSMSYMAEGVVGNTVEITTNQEAKMSKINTTGPSAANVKLLVNKETVQRNLEGTEVKINGNLRKHNHQYLANLNIESTGNSLGELIVGWDRLDFFIENLNTHSVEYSLELSTSYVPYIDQMQQANSVEVLADILQKNRVPFRRVLTGTIHPGKRMTFAPSNVTTRPSTYPEDAVFSCGLSEPALLGVFNSSS